MADRQGVLVIADVNDGKLMAISREGVALGLELASEVGGEVTALVMGTNTGAHAQELTASGAQKVLTVDNASLDGYQPDAYLQVVQKAVESVNPQVVITGQTDTGKDLAPKLAFRLQASLTMDIVAASANGGKLSVTKPVYGGNAQANYETEADLHVITVRPKAFDALEPDGSRGGSIDPLDVSIDEAELKVKVLDTKKEASAGIRLEDAPVVVSGGRGLGGPEPFEQLQELADLLGGAVGASRAVCDAGWMPHAMQVGLTGKTVTPDLYITIAISGASQHMAGCSGSKNIVSINKDKDCNIFKESRYGVVGSWEEVVPAFIETVRELRGG